MSQIVPPSETGIEERFHIAGRTAIQFMLIGFAKDRESFSVQFNAGKEMFLSTLLAVQRDQGRLVLDCSGSPETNRRFLNSERNVFVGRPGGIQVHFTTGPASEIDFEGSKAFAVPLPKVLVRLQRRDHFRIETPRVRPLHFLARLSSGELFNLPVHDLSISGIGLTAAQPPEAMTDGLELANSRFVLPNDTRDFFFSATVRHLTELEARSGSHHWRIGLQFKNLPVGDQNRIQRYIARVEHERHELS